MKDFFKKVWEAIKGFFVKVKETVVKWLASVNYIYYVMFIIGMVLTAFLAIVFPGAIEWPAVPIVGVAGVITFIKVFTDKPIQWWRPIAVALGALVIQIICWIA